MIATAARQFAEVEAVAKEAAETCGDARVLPILADVTREDDCARVVETALRRFGRLDILVNNAGRGMKYVSEKFLTEPTRFWEVSPETWRLVIDTNVNGPFLMARNAAPVMVKGGWLRRRQWTRLVGHEEPGLSNLQQATKNVFGGAKVSSPEKKSESVRVPEQPHNGFFSPKGNRTPASGVRGRRPNR